MRVSCFRFMKYDKECHDNDVNDEDDDCYPPPPHHHHHHYHRYTSQRENILSLNIAY